MIWNIGDRIIDLKSGLHGKVTWSSDGYSRLDIRHDIETGPADEVNSSVLPDDIIAEIPIWEYHEYSKWSRYIAKHLTREEICNVLNFSNALRKRLSLNHLEAIDKSYSMSGNSQMRAHSKNSMVCNYEKFNAHRNALEIYCYFPEKTKEFKCQESEEQ